jgi:DNA (cytosine-5)-methyltransferase 1
MRGGCEMKILNLFAGIGGNRTFWGDTHEITAVEYNPIILDLYIKRFPNDMVWLGDAYQYLEEYYKNFDFIWASPPCPTHSKLQHCQKYKKLPDMRLYSLIIFLKHMFWGKWVVENVQGYYQPLIKPTIKIDRHLFWSNFPIKNKHFSKFPKEHNSLSAIQLCELKNVDYNIIKNIPDKLFKRKLVRNMVRPEVGKHIFNSINNISMDKYI